MAIKREFTCIAHGVFESETAICPHGCTSTIERTYTKGSAAPRTSGKTKATDAALQRLADRFGMTDISNRNGSVKGSQRSNAPSMAPTWGEIPKGDKLVVGKGIEHVKGSGGGAEVIGNQLGQDIATDAPTFMDLAKQMPRVRPDVAKGHSFGDSSDLASAVRSSS